MTSNKTALTGKTVGIFAANGFSEAQMADIQRTVLGSGGKTKVISIDTGLISGVNTTGWGLNFPVDASIGDVLSSDFDAIVVLGGRASVEKFMTSAHTKRILNGALDAGTTVMMLDDAVTTTSLLENTSGLTVAVNDVTTDMVEGGIATETTNCVVSGQIITGTVTDEDQSVLGAFVETVSGAQETKLAA